MDLELYPTVSLKERSFNVLVALREHFIVHAQPPPHLEAIQVSLVTGNYSGILSRLHRRFRAGDPAS
ncbi:MAG: hypothetical protein LUQ38_00625 [Methanotrichaceae archaeon]|nr:hypothetical protein [Methanotrichaceae archaeon]